jgi:hypothetical protein
MDRCPKDMVIIETGLTALDGGNQVIENYIAARTAGMSTRRLADLDHVGARKSLTDPAHVLEGVDILEFTPQLIAIDVRQGGRVW